MSVPTPRVRAVLPTAMLCAALLAAACDNPAGSRPGTPGVRVVSGPATTDTIEAQPAAPLVVEVRGEDGRAAAGQTVRFRSLPTTGAEPVRGMAMSLRGSSQYRMQLDVTADAQGRASALLMFLVRAGPASIEVSLLDQAIVDTLSFTVLPGKAVNVRAAPRDTVVVVGGAYTLRASAVDRMNNATSGEPAFERIEGPATISPGGLVGGAAVGRARFRVRLGAMTDTASATVVPAGTIAFRDLGAHVGDTTGISVMDLDGSSYRRVVVTGTVDGGGRGISNDDGPRWIPGTTNLVFARRTGEHARLHVADGNVVRLLVTGADAPEAQGHPTVAPDGTWIYFVGRTGAESEALWRVRPDGTGLARLPAPANDMTHFYAPSISPDGRRIAYAASRHHAPFQLYVRDVETGTTVQIGSSAAAAPRWSPSGDRIAYTGAGRGTHSGPLRIVNADGTADRELLPVNYYPGAEWSPDGRYLLTLRSTTLELVEVETGLQLRLPYRKHVEAPAWLH
jgi:hypothetical protein